MTLTKIKWKYPDHNCLCVVCNIRQAVFIAHIDNWNLPVCLDCSKLNAKEMLKKSIGGENEISY